MLSAVSSLKTAAVALVQQKDCQVVPFLLLLQHMHKLCIVRARINCIQLVALSFRIQASYYAVVFSSSRKVARTLLEN